MIQKRNTDQKRIIMEELCHSDHPTATELYESVHKRYPTISRGTVFRVLADYAECGQINRLDLAGSATRYDARLAPHAHCHCVHCGKITDAYSEKICDLMGVKEVEDFSVITARIEFYGVCKDCAKIKNEVE